MIICSMAMIKKEPVEILANLVIIYLRSRLRITAVSSKYAENMTPLLFEILKFCSTKHLLNSFSFKHIVVLWA